MAGLGVDRYNTLAADLTEQGADQPLGILLNVAAVNKIRLDPQVLAASLKTVAVIIDINFPYRYQEKDAIGPLLTTALAEDLSWERQALAVRLAAELTVKYGRPRQPVKKVLWQLSREVHGFEARIMVDSALDLLESEEADRAGQVLFIEQDIMKSLPGERPPIVIGKGFTVRRPVAKLGRNEPCHCGSGKKYKKCCRARDDELLRDASSYEGVTRSQILAEPSLVKDTAPIEEMRPYELKKLKPSLMNDEQLFAGYQRADLFGLGEFAFEMLLELKHRPGKEEFAVGHMCDLFHEALRCQDKELARRLTMHIPAEDLYFNEADKLQHALLEDPDRYAELETLCRKAFATDKQSSDHPLLGLSYAFEKILPAMSIVFGRAAIVSEPKRWLDNDTLFDCIQRNRILLDLEPWGDPIEEYLDWTTEKNHERSVDKDKDRKIEQLKEQLAAARDKSALAAKELRAKEIELAGLEQKVADAGRAALEKKPEPSAPGDRAPAVTGAAAPADAGRQQINKLRKKIAVLKGAISSHQESRRQYRQQLQAADRVISKLSSRQPAPDEPSAPMQDLDPAITVPKKVQIPEFADSFRKSCENLPPAIVAKALRAAVGFAARDNAILRQAAVLERLPGVFRLRIGIHYRLLVRQAPEEMLQVMDIIPRAQLETWIRRHAT
ncbi:MAG: SEC-C domain-containing protein [Desulfobacterales bacterium]|nr:SEC-C domain-containing protein [Desulfobacterales bacterium]